MDDCGGLSVYRGCAPVVDAKYDFECNRSATEAVIIALADAGDVDPIDLPPLYNYVDPDALNALFDRDNGITGGSTVVSFEVDTWNVFVRSDGRIRICDGTQPTEIEPAFSPTSA